MSNQKTILPLGGAAQADNDKHRLNYIRPDQHDRSVDSRMSAQEIIAAGVVCGGVVLILTIVLSLIQTAQCWGVSEWQPSTGCTMARAFFWLWIGALVLGTIATLCVFLWGRFKRVQAEYARGTVTRDRWSNPVSAMRIHQMTADDMARYFTGAARAEIAMAPYKQYPAGLDALSISNAAMPMPALEDSEEDGNQDPFSAALASLPRVIDLEHIFDSQPSAFSVPLGQDHTGAQRWLDMRKDMLHAGIFGGTGAGKDNLLEAWFLALTRQNTPDQLQFAVLDGKGHWMQPSISGRAHMWIAPAGGIGQEGQDALKAALVAIQAEAKRRGQLVFGADCDTLERYIQKTGERIPYLVVFVSDVMGNIVGDVDKLLVDLVSKARALGIRVVVSMQTPTKQNTQWRANLSTVLCGQLQGRSNDSPALGIGESDMLFPPSQLPDPKERPGIFSVRRGNEQWLIQAPLVRRDFHARCIAELPMRAALGEQPKLSPLERIRARTAAMTEDQREQIARQLAQKGASTREMQFASRLRNERVCEIWREIKDNG